MRIVIGIVFITIMGCVFTLMTAMMFVTQHPFASVVLTCLPAAALVAMVRRHKHKTRRSQPELGQPDAMTGPPLNRWATSQMSSAVPPRRGAPTLPRRFLT
ncbi:hypothetical protein SKC41_30375 [Mycobacterium sp. 050128]|uniref:hypothetical protein n=1 Tax=Mycobacterium sp. 050128 TaxID=3096112 RepID=UPI002ED7C5C9